MEMGTRTPAGEGDRDGLTYPNGRAPKREKRRLPPRTCCLAVVLTLIGSLLLVVSLVALANAGLVANLPSWPAEPGAVWRRAGGGYAKVDANDAA